jgi:hypothetical protein
MLDSEGIASSRVPNRLAAFKANPHPQSVKRQRTALMEPGTVVADSLLPLFRKARHALSPAVMVVEDGVKTCIPRNRDHHGVNALEHIHIRSW